MVTPQEVKSYEFVTMIGGVLKGGGLRRDKDGNEVFTDYCYFKRGAYWYAHRKPTINEMLDNEFK